MNTFANVLKELMEEKSVEAKILARYLEFSDASVIYRWLKGEKSLLLTTAVKVAEFFDCSLDYLFGRTDDYKSGSYKACLSFDIQLKIILDEQKVSQYKLVKDKILSKGNIDSWLNKKQIPRIDSIIKLADYLKISMDYLVGREK